MEKLKKLMLFAVFLFIVSGCRKNDAWDIPTQETNTANGVFEEARGDGEEKTEEEEKEKEDDAGREEKEGPEQGNVTVTMLDVGQGLCILAESDGRYMVYDGGDREHSSYVVSYFRSHGIEHVDLMIASHYDEDHIAGLVGLLNTAEVDRLVIPEYESDTKIYSSFMEAGGSAGETVYAEKGSSFVFGDAAAEILYACDGTEPSENDMSTVVKIVCGGSSVCLITGDAEQYEENVLLDEYGSALSCPLYVVGHHGSSSSSGKDLVNAISPSYAFISVGADNDYGHPSQKTLDTLSACGAEIFRSDLNGNVMFSYDAGKATVSCDRQLPQNEDDGNGHPSTGYVLNTSSGKFHYPDCEAVEKMAEHNKKEVDAGRDELLKEGYLPCGICRP